MINMNGILDVLVSNLSISSVWTSIGEFFLSMFLVLSMWILGLVKGILTLIFDIAGLDFFDKNVIGELSTRVYIIVGILMLFKITISCLQYLINPDKSDDKENGFGAIAKRAIFAVALLALVPSIFHFAKVAQTGIVEALPKIILGVENSSKIQDVADDLAYSTALGFFGYSSEKCNDGSIAGLPGASSNPKFSSISDIISNRDEVVSGNNCNGDNRYSFNYLCIPAAIYLIFVLISMALDVGVRTIKFGFLQLIAPIPIASYIDPKSSKKSFDSWVHNCVTVYTDLFIRLGVIYLVLYLAKIILGAFKLKGSYVIGNENIGIVRSQLVNVAIIIALITFAKNAPKFISDVLGLKGDGNIGDMFKRAGGLAGAGLGMGRDGYAGYRNKMNKLRENKKPGDRLTMKDRAKALKSAIGTAGSSAKTGFGSVLHNKGFKDTLSSSKTAAARGFERREAMHDNNVSAFDYYKQVLNRRMGINPVVDSANAEIEAGKSASDSAKAALDYVHSNAAAKFTNVAFADAFMSESVKGKLKSVPSQLVIGLDAAGNEIKINKSDLITEYRKDANGNYLRDADGKLIVSKAAKYSIADVQAMLNSVINDRTGKYDGVNSVYQSKATGLQDLLNGIGDMYIVNNATNKDSGVANNPAFNNSIQSAISAFMKNSGDTDFGRSIIEDSKHNGWIASDGSVITEHIGDFLSYVKGKGQDVQTAQKKVVGAQGAELVAKGIADKYDKK